MMRYSFGRDPRAEKTKSVRKLDSCLPPRAKDDDLVLFNDMQSKERDCFLLHTADDIDDSIAKLRYFSDNKTGIGIPIRGESCDLLNTDGDKNDYDWLLTPPDTPLFPSLDDDEIQPVGSAQRGRRSEPIAIPRSSTGENPQRSSRSSASPHRLSPSPRSNSRGRASSAPQSSPPTVLRQTTPSRRSITPPNKSSPPPRRSTTPTLVRMSSGSSSQASSSGRRGVSPVKTNHGNSSFPKLQGWQANLPGFSSDVPPNLRTSLSDRSPSYTRGSSPASRNGRDSSSQHGRQPVSPTASRSAGSSHRLEQDRFSFYSRGSAASSGEDDIDSLQSASLGISGDSNARKNIMISNNRSLTSSKRSSRNPYATSAPKRSFDPMLRKDNHNMFRPLLSSVPSTTFYYGKSNTLQRPMFSRNSSLTTSSNTSSELGVSIIHDIGGVHEQNDLAAELEKRRGRGTQEVDRSTGGTADKGGAKQLKKSSESFGDRISAPSASESSCTGGHNSEFDICVMAICSRCGTRFRIIYMDEETVCENCTRNDDHITPSEYSAGLTVIHDDKVQLETDISNGILSKEQLSDDITKLPDNSNCLPETCSSRPVIDETSKNYDEQHLSTNHEENSCQYDDDNKFQSLQFSAHSNLKIEKTPAVGISVLLERPGCSKGPLLQGRVFSATSILCSEPSYARENTSYMNRSFSRDGGSASSSIDLGSSRQSEPRTQRHQSSNKKPEGNMGNKNPGLLYPGIQSSAHAVLIHSESNEEDSMDTYTKDLDSEFSSESKMPTRKQSLDAELCTMPSSSLQEEVAAGVLFFDDSVMDNTHDLQFRHLNDHTPDIMGTEFVKEACSMAVTAQEDVQRTGLNFQDMNSINSATHSSDDNNTSSGIACHVVINDAEENHSAIDLGRISDHGLDIARSSSLDRINVQDSGDCSTLTNPETTIESNLDHEEPRVELESRYSRTLAMSEATDTILFCSSIIHDIAYNAATIAMERELACATSSPLTAVAMPGKSVFRQQVSRTIPRRRASKSLKTKRKKPDADSNLVPIIGDEGKSPGLRPVSQQGRAANADIAMAPKVESKCNCTVM